MSSQLNFYLLPQCLRDILLECSRVNRGVFCGKDTVPLPEWELTSHTRFALLPEDLVQLGARDIETVNVTFHCVIEVNPGVLTKDAELVRGRLYFSRSYFEGSVLVEKRREFINWAATWFRYFKRRMHKYDYGWSDETTISWMQSGHGVFHDGLAVVAPRPA